MREELFYQMLLTTVPNFRCSLHHFCRVHTALAALAAEKQSLMSKLALIDGELEVKKVKLNKSYGKK